MVFKLFRKTPLAWLQMTREKSRLSVAIVGIAFADILLYIQMGFSSALYNSAVRPQNSLKGDLFLINSQFETTFSVKSFPRQRLYQAAGFEGVESISPLYIYQGFWRNPITRMDRRILVFGIDPANSAFKSMEINQYLNELKNLNTVLFDQGGRPEYGDIAGLYHQLPSVETELNNAMVRVVGLFTMGASFSGDGNIITSDSTFRQLFPERQADQIEVGSINLKSGVDLNQVKADLAATLPTDIKVLTKEEFIQLEKKYWANTTAIGFVFGLGSVVAFIVGTVIVYQILYSDVCDHLPEYATLKAMGYGDRYLISVILQESLILAVLGFIPGLAISFGVYHIAQISTKLPVIMTTNRAIFVLILTVAMCSISGGIAIHKLRKADPADIF